jgi:hypothetical protein
LLFFDTATGNGSDSNKSSVNCKSLCIMAVYRAAITG